MNSLDKLGSGSNTFASRCYSCNPPDLVRARGIGLRDTFYHIADPKDNSRASTLEFRYVANPRIRRRPLRRHTRVQHKAASLLQSRIDPKEGWPCTRPPTSGTTGYSVPSFCRGIHMEVVINPLTFLRRVRAQLAMPDSRSSFALK